MKIFIHGNYRKIVITYMNKKYMSIDIERPWHCYSRRNTYSWTSCISLAKHNVGWTKYPCLYVNRCRRIFIFGIFWRRPSVRHTKNSIWSGIILMNDKRNIQIFGGLLLSSLLNFCPMLTQSDMQYVYMPSKVNCEMYAT